MARRKDGITLSKASPLVKAVMRHGRLTVDQMLEVAEHGADAGWPGFTYYGETSKFAGRHRKMILDELEKDLVDFDEKTITAMIKGWKCLSMFDEHEIEVQVASFMFNGDSDVQFDNAMAWYALEKAAQELAKESHHATTLMPETAKERR